MKCKVCKKTVDYQEKNGMCDSCFECYLRLQGEDYTDGSIEEVQEDPRKIGE